jgi:hypothetical protein
LATPGVQIGPEPFNQSACVPACYFASLFRFAEASEFSSTGVYPPCLARTRLAFSLLVKAGMTDTLLQVRQAALWATTFDLMFKILAKVLLVVLFLKAGPRRQTAALGVLLVLMGLGSALSATVRQKGGAAPPLEGPVATGVGICLIAVGSVLVFLAARRAPKPGGNRHCSAEPCTAPNVGPAVSQDSSKPRKGPPSVS